MTSITSRHPSLERSTARALHRLEGAQRAAEAGSTLGVADRRLMWLFTDGRPRTLREVVEALGLEQSTVNRQVNKALAEGLLRRSRDSGRSVYQLTATEHGVETFESEAARHLDLLRRGLEALPRERRAPFVEELLQFVDAYGASADSDRQTDQVSDAPDAEGT